MARIRTIKPEFWSSEQVVECSAMARLLFIGLWNFCDDAGIHPTAEKTIKMRVFPGDDISTESIRRLIDELSSKGLIDLYEVEGVEYLMVTGWDKHQKVERPSYKYPSPPTERRKRNSHSTNDRRTIDARHPPEGKEGNGKEGNGAVIVEPSTNAADAADPEPLWRQVIQAFDRARAEAFGEPQARAWPHPNDRGDAARFLEAGATVELCASVFEAVCRRLKAANRQPPGNLRYFQSAIADTIASGKAPMPAPSVPAAPRPRTKAEDDEFETLQAGLIKRRGYQSDVSATEVRQMITKGKLTRDEAVKAGYAP